MKTEKELLEIAIENLASTSRGRRIVGELHPILKEATGLDLSFRDDLVTIFAVLKNNTLNGTILDLTRSFASRNRTIFSDLNALGG